MVVHLFFNELFAWSSSPWAQTAIHLTTQNRTAHSAEMKPDTAVKDTAKCRLALKHTLVTLSDLFSIALPTQSAECAAVNAHSWQGLNCDCLAFLEIIWNCTCFKGSHIWIRYWSGSGNCATVPTNFVYSVQCCSAFTMPQFNSRALVSNRISGHTLCIFLYIFNCNQVSWQDEKSAKIMMFFLLASLSLSLYSDLMGSSYYPMKTLHVVID